MEVKSAADVSQRAVGAACAPTSSTSWNVGMRARLAAWLARHPSPASAPTWAWADSPRTRFLIRGGGLKPRERGRLVRAPPDMVA